MIRKRTEPKVNQVSFESISDPRVAALADIEHKQFLDNLNWFQAHAGEIRRLHGGKHICIAGQELFVGESPQVVWDKSVEAYPNDHGRYLKFIRQDNSPRIYAN